MVRDTYTCTLITSCGVVLSEGFERRTGSEHRQHAHEARALVDETERQTHFDKYGIRWTELARLPYFDVVRQTVIDPMHNLLLGIAKSQWFDRWIQTSTLRAATSTRARELDIIHKFLANFEVPAWAGKLPARVGEPAGGSLTADEYKFATTTAWPLLVRSLVVYPYTQIPIIWDISFDEAQSEHRTSAASYPARLRKYEKDVAAWKLTRQGTQTSVTGQQKKGKGEREPRKPMPPKLRMHTSALSLYTNTNILTLAQIYGVDALRPNFHWATHLSDQILDYGPVYNFWAFLSEHLNKVLKSSNTNNWTGGQVEISMMREFARASRIDSMVRSLNFHTCFKLDCAFFQARVIVHDTDNSYTKLVLETILHQPDEGGTLRDALASDGTSYT
ncbi:hypothetical protein CONPUDRAFT_67603 [Coniophora puteana RWD-64-598 SS2]|uniref:Uncharacterized protein n=1 Tax=Coniophora puteana (strain RWD-64-598) TaxID=741705 RepID=R7SE93_CONPW|nr:uncharacterized protein CONPUDRAFT_67603 [Coniophora puteana RWD-64-598 SS2]EIW74493.1 hypothetical protein CONPUDRAFT_67603 [Coniophora puteana RWD-64-598 SS2]